MKSLVHPMQPGHGKDRQRGVQEYGRHHPIMIIRMVIFDLIRNKRVFQWLNGNSLFLLIVNPADGGRTGECHGSKTNFIFPFSTPHAQNGVLPGTNGRRCAEGDFLPEKEEKIY